MGSLTEGAQTLTHFNNLREYFNAATQNNSDESTTSVNNSAESKKTSHIHYILFLERQGLNRNPTLQKPLNCTGETSGRAGKTAVLCCWGNSQRYWATVHLSSTTSTGPPAVPGQLWFPFSRADISNILCSPSTSPHLLSPQSQQMTMLSTSRGK